MTLFNETGNDATVAYAERGRTRRSIRLAAVIAMACLLSGGLGAGLASSFENGAPGVAQATMTKAVVRSTRSATGTIGTSQIAAMLDPAVVNVNTELDALEGGGAAAGTGMVVTKTGEIVTNNHVVQGADTVRVSIAGHGTHLATVVGTDPSADVAVLRVSGFTNLPTVSFGDSSAVTVGDQIVAIGNALGLGGSPTVTQGIISAKGRTISASDETGSNEETLHGLLQTDAPIAPGNSGGPLVDASGKVVGMDTAAASSGSVGASLGFAIPSNTVEKIAAEIASHKDLPGLVFGRTPFLGVEVVDSSEVGSGLNPFGPFGSPFGFGFGFGPVATTPNGTPGVVVAAVDPNSPAASAGIVSGDVITACDGQATATTTSLSKVVDAHRAGQIVILTLSTQDGTKTVQVKLGKGPID
jgi:S1-C subfamily serine protease